MPIVEPTQLGKWPHAESRMAIADSIPVQIYEWLHLDCIAATQFYHPPHLDNLTIALDRRLAGLAWIIARTAVGYAGLPES